MRIQYYVKMDQFKGINKMLIIAILFNTSKKVKN